MNLSVVCALASRRRSSITVAILAQGTLWAVAVTQAFYVFCCHVCPRAQCHVPRLILVAMRQGPRVRLYRADARAVANAALRVASPQRRCCVASPSPAPAVYATSTERAAIAVVVVRRGPCYSCHGRCCGRRRALSFVCAFLSLSVCVSRVVCVCVALCCRCGGGGRVVALVSSCGASGRLGEGLDMCGRQRLTPRRRARSTLGMGAGGAGVNIRYSLAG